jgi:hypothetical protein
MTANTVDPRLLTRSQLAPEQNTDSTTMDAQTALGGAPLASQMTESPNFTQSSFPQYPISNVATRYDHVAVDAPENLEPDYTVGSLQGPSIA